MAWDKGGRYYSRSRRVNGRVVREYIGGGMLGQLAAQRDALARDKRETERACAKIEREQIEALDAPLAELDELADLLARAALAAVGYAQHNRGEWRKNVAEVTKPAGVVVPRNRDEIKALLKRTHAGDETTLPVVRKMLENPAYISMLAATWPSRWSTRLPAPSAAKTSASARPSCGSWG